MNERDRVVDLDGVELNRHERDEPVEQADHVEEPCRDLLGHDDGDVLVLGPPATLVVPILDRPHDVRLISGSELKLDFVPRRRLRVEQKHVETAGTGLHPLDLLYVDLAQTEQRRLVGDLLAEPLLVKGRVALEHDPLVLHVLHGALLTRTARVGFVALAGAIGGERCDRAAVGRERKGPFEASRLLDRAAHPTTPSTMAADAQLPTTIRPVNGHLGGRKSLSGRISARSRPPRRPTTRSGQWQFLDLLECHSARVLPLDPSVCGTAEQNHGRGRRGPEHIVLGEAEMTGVGDEHCSCGQVVA